MPALHTTPGTQELTATSSWQSRLSGFASLVKAELKAHLCLVIICVLYFAASVSANLYYDRPVGVSFWPYFSTIFGFILPLVLAAILPLQLIYMAFISRPKSPSREMIRIYKSLLTDPRRWAKAVPAIVIMMFGFAAYTDFKGLIPLMHDFAWDEAFMKLDRIVHLEQDPWRLLYPLLGSATATVAINFVYNLWFIVMFCFWLAAGWTRQDNGWERQFLLSFILCWIIGGTILATIFSSMGPVYYDLIDPANNPYAVQMAGLIALGETYPIWALGAQDMLRDAYLNPGDGKLSGISAMPSLHNATSTLFMLAAFRINKKFGWVMAAFLAVIIVGSVHLAWHYAIDAYAGIAIAVLLWWAAGKILRSQDHRLGMTQPAT